MRDDDDRLDRAIDMLRRPLERNEAAIEEIVRAATRRRRSRFASVRPGLALFRRGLASLRRPRLVLSPLAAGAWAVVAVSIAVAAVVASSAGGARPFEETVVRHQFVLVAPEARAVSLVGDFNDWQVDATPLTWRGGAWTVEVPLRTGRHVYSFVVDGEWRADATAPRAPEDDFGRPSSVLVMTERGT